MVRGALELDAFSIASHRRQAPDHDATRGPDALEPEMPYIDIMLYKFFDRLLFTLSNEFPVFGVKPPCFRN